MAFWCLFLWFWMCYHLARTLEHWQSSKIIWILCRLFNTQIATTFWQILRIKKGHVEKKNKRHKRNFDVFLRLSLSQFWNVLAVDPFETSRGAKIVTALPEVMCVVLLRANTNTLKYLYCVGWLASSSSCDFFLLRHFGVVKYAIYLWFIFGQMFVNSFKRRFFSRIFVFVCILFWSALFR